MKKLMWATIWFFLALISLHADLTSADIRLISMLNTINFEEEFDFHFLLNYQTEEIKNLLNSCFARHGRPFSSRHTRDIFQNTIWYQVNPLYTNQMLTKIDKINILKLRSMLVLSEENTTFLYQIKRIHSYKSANDEIYPIQINIDKEKSNFSIRGTIKITGTPWDSQFLINRQTESIELIKDIPFAEYGPESWFIYNGTFYFFITETVEVDPLNTIKIRKYLSCNIDYKDKILSKITLWSATTGDF